MKRLFPFAFLCGALGLAQPTDKWKLDAGIVVNTVLVQDDCINDFLRAYAQSGLERRKMISEMQRVGCLKPFPDSYVAFSSGTKSFKGEGKSFSMRRVVLIDPDLIQVAILTNMDKEAFAKHFDTLEGISGAVLGEPHMASASMSMGWIPADSYMKSGRDELLQLYGPKKEFKPSPSARVAPVPIPQSSPSAGKISNQ